MVIYFFTQYKTKCQQVNFSIPVWLKDNWYNLPITLAAVVAYFIISDSITKVEALAIGLIPNYITDRIAQFVEANKNKS